jgi:hypothetical protein
MSELCFRILPALREAWSAAGNDAADWRAAVEQEKGLPAYFRRVEGIARDPFNEASLARFLAVYDPDRQMILHCALLRMAKDDGLAADDRATVHAMLKLEGAALYGS